MALLERPALAAHAAIETYSVLTRLPSPHRATPEQAREYIEAVFDERYLIPAAHVQQGMVNRLAGLGVHAGAVYDGVVALTVADVGALLLTLDRRARSTYDRCGVAFRLLAQ